MIIGGACDLAVGEALEETDHETDDGNRPATEEAAMREPRHDSEPPFRLAEFGSS